MEEGSTVVTSVTSSDCFSQSRQDAKDFTTEYSVSVSMECGLPDAIGLDPRIRHSITPNTV